MPYELLTVYLNLPVFAMVASRLGGLIMFQPVLNSLSIPLNLRVMFVLALAALVTPSVGIDAETPASVGSIAIAMAGEVALGLMIGTVVMITFVGLQIGGQLIAQQSGLAFGRIADPSTGSQQTVLSVFYVQFGVVTYLIVGGHRAVVLACLQTFDSIPLLGGADEALNVELLIDSISLGAAVAIRVAAPAVITLFLVNIALGFISRTVPQLNIATVGFTLKSLIAFVIMAVSLPAAMNVYADQLETVVGWLDQLTRAASPGG